MRWLVMIVGMLAVVVGFGLFASAAYTPYRYQKPESAIVETAIQMESAVQVLYGIGAFAFAILCEISVAAMTITDMFQARWREEDRRASQPQATVQPAQSPASMRVAAPIGSEWDPLSGLKKT